MQLQIFVTISEVSGIVPPVPIIPFENLYQYCGFMFAQALHYFKIGHFNTSVLKKNLMFHVLFCY